MNYQHVDHKASADAARRALSAGQQKKAFNAERIEHLNRLTRYPSLAAMIVATVALLSAAIHLIR